MNWLRRLIADRRLGGAFSVVLAYLFFAQASMAGVGMVMSAGPGQISSDVSQIICTHDGGVASLPAAPDDRPAPERQQDCSFCLAAAQMLGHVANIGAAGVAARVLPPSFKAFFKDEAQRLTVAARDYSPSQPRAPPIRTA